MLLLLMDIFKVSNALALEVVKFLNIEMNVFFEKITIRETERTQMGV